MKMRYRGKLNLDGSDPMMDEAYLSPDPHDLWEMCQTWKRELDHLMLTVVEKIGYQAEAPSLSPNLEPNEICGLPGVSQASMAYKYMPDSLANVRQAASTARASVAQVNDETAAQRILELDRELAIERELHRRTRDDLAGVTTQLDEALVELCT